MSKRAVLEADANVVGHVLSCDEPRLANWFKRDYLYVDKSLFIREFMDRSGNMLFTRPRCFGKTLNMMLLQKFLSLFEEEPDEMFKALKIFQDVDFVNEHHRKHPVFFISFASVTSGDWEAVSSEIKSCVLESMEPLKRYLTTVNMDVDSAEKETYQEMIVLLEKMNDDRKDAHDVINHFENMIGLVKYYFGIRPILLVDEYNAPMRTANENGFLDDALDILMPFYTQLSKVLSVKLCLVGILVTIPGTIFSGLNNLVFCDIGTDSRTRNQFSNMFGFTKEEVEELVQKCHESGLSVPTVEELEGHYGGYVLGCATHMFNPYSVMHALYKGKLGNYWTAAGAGINIFNFLKSFKLDLNLAQLLEFITRDSRSIEVYIDEAYAVAYGGASSLTTFHTILYHCGYLTKAIKEGQGGGPIVRSIGALDMVTLKVPNYEALKNLKSDLFEFFFNADAAQKLTELFAQGLEENDFQGVLGFIVENTTVALDSKAFPKREKERNHHMAFALFFSHLYHIHYRTERYRHLYKANTGPELADLVVKIPIAGGEVLGIIFEFTYAQEEQEMEKRAREGLRQIADNNCLSHFVQMSTVRRVLLVGTSCHGMKIAFCYQLAARTSPSEPWILASSEAQCCILSCKPESRATKE